MTKQTILVTGAAGFIGSNLVDYLLSIGHRVVGIDNYDPFYPRPIKEQNLSNARSFKDFVMVEGDIRDVPLLDECFKQYRPDVVVHLAAKAGVRPSIEDPQAYFDVNVIGTLNILETMRREGISKLIFASSSSVYGNNKKTPFSEDDPVDNPISPYAASKKAGELICHSYHHLYGFDIFCLRFFTVYGPRQRPDLAIHKFTDLMLKNQSIPMFGDGSTARDYTYISDIIDGVISSIELVTGFDVINLGESKTIKLVELIALLENEIGMKAIIDCLPMQPGDVELTFADISKAHKKLGYHPKFSKEEGIREFVKWKLKNFSKF